jgi:ribosomal protein S12 methylthiotransferase
MLWGIEAIRKHIPGAVLRTTIIVGFPGETDEEFKDLMDFLKDVRFERLGAFMYSPEEGAKSVKMPDPIPQDVKQERYNAVMAQQQEISREFHESWVGKSVRVLIDEKSKDEEGVYYGRTYADAPDVDGQVIVHSGKPLKIGQFADVKITDGLEYDLVGTAA